MQVMGSQKVRKEEKMAYGMFGLKTHLLMPPISWMSDSPDLPVGPSEVRSILRC